MTDEKRWTASQLYAINCRERDLLLSAGAGSGKTATLTERVCRLICEEGADISRMLIVTFTRAAAAELRSRVRDRIEKKLAEDPGSDHLARQIIAADSADISTISGFFLKALRPHFAVLGLPPSFGVGDESEIKVIKSRIMSDVIDDFFDEGKDSFISLADTLSSSRDDTSVNAVILSVADRLSAKGYGAEKLAEWAEGLSEAAQGDFLASPHGKVIRDYTRSFIDHTLESFESVLEELERDELLKSKYTESAAEHIGYLKKLSRATEAGYAETKEALESFAASRLPVIKSDLKSPLSERYSSLKSDFKDSVKKDLSPLYRYSEEEISSLAQRTASLVAELGRVVGVFDERFAEEKRRLGIVDYTDLEVFAKRVFVTDDGRATPAAKELSKRYDYIFIDEYQDTNSVQDAVFSALSENCRRFMVGDVKQSIYAFRGGEPSVFVSYRDKFPKADLSRPGEGDSGRTLFMSENFRSDSSVIDFVNLVSEFMFPGTSTPFEDGDRLVFSKNLPEGYRERKAELILVEDGSDQPEEDGASSPSYDAEAEYTAERIFSLLQSEKRGDGSPFSERDIAILVRSGAHAAPFEAALRRRGIAVSDRATVEFFEQKEILLVLCLLNMIDNPLRDIYLAGALKSPVFAFSMEDVIRVRIGKTGVPLWFCLTEYAKNGEDGRLAAKCRRVVGFAERFSRSAKNSDAAKTVLSLYNELSLYSLTDGAPFDSGRALSVRENLTALYEMARRYCASAYGGLYGFIEYLNEKMQRSSEVVKKPDENSVSIITIHKAKGLEYPVCFLVKCSSRFNFRDLADGVLFDPELGPAMRLRDATGLVVFDTPLRAVLSHKLKYEKICEEMRILYVALTRAKERLFVTAEVQNAEEAADAAANAKRAGSEYSAVKITSFAKILIPAAVKGSEEGRCIITKVSRSGIGFTRSERRADVFEETEDDPTELYRERLRFKYPSGYLATIPAKVTVSKLSPSLLDEDEVTGEFEIPEGVTKRMRARDAAPRLRLTDEDADGAERGTATHVFLQFCDFGRLTPDGIEEEIERLCAKKFLTRKMASLVNRDEIAAFVSGELFGRIKSSKRVYREFRFNASLPACDFTRNEELASELRSHGTDVIVQGVVDIVFEDEDGKLTLIDYKTDRLSAWEIDHPDEAKRTLAERHRTQLTYYKAACEVIFERKIDEVAVYSLALGDTAPVI